MDLIIVRHGLSEANKKDLVGGLSDTKLTREGKDQAEQLAQRLANHEIDVIYSSPFKRTMETASPIAQKLNKDIRKDHRIAEVNWGSFEGISSQEFQKITGSLPWESLDTYEYDYNPHGGESAKEVEARVKSFLDDLKKQPHKKVLIVSHGGIVRWLHYLTTGEKVSRQPNGKEIHLTI